MTTYAPIVPYATVAIAPDSKEMDQGRRGVRGRRLKWRAEDVVVMERGVGVGWAGAQADWRGEDDEWMNECALDIEAQRCQHRSPGATVEPLES